MRLDSVLLATAAAIAVAPCTPAQTVADVYKRVKDTVVTIRTVEHDPMAGPAGATGFEGLGSGVVVDPSGWVLTAAHVVQTAEEVNVELASGETVPAKVVASEVLVDLALLKLDRAPAKLVAAQPGDSSRLEIGDPIFIVGAPLGISQSLTVGHVSGRRQANALFGGFEAAELIQTDAAINTGNSGGPMFNMRGEVVGIVSSILSRSGGFEGIGFAVSSNTVQVVLGELVRHGRVRRAFLGLTGQRVVLPPAIVERLALPAPTAVAVMAVAGDSPAARAGLRAGDVLVSLGGAPTVAPDALLRWLTGDRVGGSAEAVVLREGALLRLAVTPTAR